MIESSTVQLRPTKVEKMTPEYRFSTPCYSQRDAVVTRNVGEVGCLHFPYAVGGQSAGPGI